VKKTEFCATIAYVHLLTGMRNAPAKGLLQLNGSDFAGKQGSGLTHFEDLLERQLEEVFLVKQTVPEASPSAQGRTRPLRGSRAAQPVEKLHLLRAGAVPSRARRRRSRAPEGHRLARGASRRTSRQRCRVRPRAPRRTGAGPSGDARGSTCDHLGSAWAWGHSNAMRILDRDLVSVSACRCGDDRPRAAHTQVGARSAPDLTQDPRNLLSDPASSFPCAYNSDVPEGVRSARGVRPQIRGEKMPYTLAVPLGVSGASQGSNCTSSETKSAVLTPPRGRGGRCWAAKFHW